MVGDRLAQRPPQRPSDSPAPGRFERPSVSQSLLSLQRRAGNRAVSLALARETIKDESPGFHGDGTHKPTDVSYADEIGKADAARLHAMTQLGAADRADINAKLRWFQGKAHGAYVARVRHEMAQVVNEIDMADDPAVNRDHSEWRMRLERQVNDWFNVIQKLKHDRIEVWEKNARKPDSKIGLEVLMIVISIVSEGLGGVVYGVVEEMLARRGAGLLLKEFAALSGLEAGNLAAEGIFHEAIDFAKSDIEKGIRSAGQQKYVEASARAALATKTDALGAFVEGMKLQTIREEAEQHVAFNNTAASKTDDKLLDENAGLKLIYDQLLAHPEAYMQQLTAGYIRMLDEAMLAGKDKKYAGDRERTFREDPDAHDGWFRAGNLVIEEIPGHSFGKWDSADLNFSGFKATGGAINEGTLENLKDARLGDLPLTMVFWTSIHDPYNYLLEKGGTTSLQFVRDPHGHIMTGDSDTELEWLASYFTGFTREHSDQERKKYAPLGAEKLYQAIKDKPVLETESVKV